MSVFSKLCNHIIDFGTKKNGGAKSSKIRKITPHHMAGNIAAGDCAKNHRDGSSQCSANYYIGNDGFIVGGVPEDKRAWTSASSWNDDQSITFEVANCSGAPEWKISDAAYKSLVSLSADICKRYGITPHYDGTKNGSITIHQMFTATACPGPYLKKLIESGQFEKDIKAAMGAEQKKPAVSEVLYRVQVGAFKKADNARAMNSRISNARFDTYLIKVGDTYKIQVGAFTNKKNAEALEKQIKAFGFDAFITTESGTAVRDVENGKSAKEIAQEIFKGIGGWGNEPERSRKLKAAGYDPEEVQKEVNKLFK